MVMPSFELGAEALNSGPRAYIASVLICQAISPAQEDWVLQYSGHNMVSQKLTQNKPLDYT